MELMSESEFNRHIDDTLLAIESAIDGADTDLDYENSGGVLTVHCGNGSQIIINRQTPVRQLWLATRSGGYHFDWDDDAEGWVRDSDGAAFTEVLAGELVAQCGETLEL